MICPRCGVEKSAHCFSPTVKECRECSRARKRFDPTAVAPADQRPVDVGRLSAPLRVYKSRFSKRDPRSFAKHNKLR